MNPIPPGVPPSGALAVDGNLHLIMLAALAALLVMLGLIVWRLWHLDREPARLSGAAAVRSRALRSRSGRRTHRRAALLGVRPATHHARQGVPALTRE
jgi:hypothetical protein